MLLFLPGRGFVFIQQQECSMEVNISLEDLFGDSIREMRERDKAFLPEPEWFSRIETDLDTFMQTYMTKYPFTSFEAIPGDESGLTFPAFEDLQFYRHCCKVSDEAAFCLIQRPYISKTLLTRRISPRGSP
ncbi:hypothetical protein PHA77_17485 (plasmid) [Edwardsiella tarda]|uniref:hypothetical protein n=1 Tax=Edwardsiella tarda TaxID=636 RepID=UPI0024440561|nr:hypothetical protein [Edwardsiella tarda]WGE30818.1 hypothetical protein PHA77_17485 [Edwardsiella tarda]